MSILMIPAQFYIGSIASQTETMGQDLSSSYQIMFVIFSFSGVLLGRIFDYFGFAFVSFMVVSFFIIAYSILLTDIIELQYVSFAFYSTGRLLMFGGFFSEIGIKYGFK
eukprot:UN34903